MPHFLELMTQIYVDLLAPGTESVGRTILRIVGVKEWENADSFVASLLGATIIAIAIVGTIVFVMWLLSTS
jgi:hypothetical protein